MQGKKSYCVCQRCRHEFYPLTNYCPDCGSKNLKRFYPIYRERLAEIRVHYMRALKGGKQCF